MKFSHIIVLYLSAMAAPSVLAAPLRHDNHCSPGTTDVRCVAHTDGRDRTSSLLPSGGSAQLFDERGIGQTLQTVLEGLPIVGPILGPLLKQLLGAIGLLEMDVASASKASLNSEQIATLASFEFALSNAVNKVLLSDGNLDSGAQSRLKARGVVPLGELATSVPIIGGFLQPFVPLLGSLGFESVDAKLGSVFSMELMNEEQSAKLALFQTIFQQELASILPNVSNFTTPDARVPSKASPDDVKPSTPGLSPDTPGDDGPNSDSSLPVDSSPADVPNSILPPTASPERMEDADE
ncbi:hypothetical protein BJ322DRAFT_698526 [Thelephora terrestris]|uniref:Uncharacterized protein n=1 Tax=Thelephora terrestris TaxID=56493 RepID=A0A9P6L8E2_9AGAM|nr:hypothetical protein BJ322DRAFT_698526 [Thelephora terrestris]